MAIIALAALATACSRTTSEEHLEAARAAMEARDYPAAAIELKNALQRDGGNAEARVLLARTLLAVGDTRGAEEELERAYEAGAEPTPLRALHYRIQIILGNYNQVLVSLVQPGGSDGLTVAEAETFRGEANLGLAKYPASEQSFRAAIAADPDYGRAQAGLGALLMSADRMREAREHIDTVVETHPDLSAGWLLRGQLGIRQGRLKDARQDLKKAVELARVESDRLREFIALGGLAEVQIGSGDLEAADKTVEELQTIGRGTRLVHQISARLYFARQMFPEARAELQQVLAADSDDPRALYLLGEVYLAEGNYVLAEQHLERVVAMRPADARARKLLAEAQFRQSRPDSATEALAPLLASGSRLDKRTSVLAGRALLGSGDTEQAVELLEKNYEADPGNLQIAMSLGGAYLTAGRINDAIELIESLPPGNDYRRDLLLAVAYGARDDPDQAQAQIDRVLSQHPKDVGALLLVANYYFTTDQVDKSRACLERVLEIDPRNVRARLDLARHDFKARDFAQGRARLESVLEDQPENITALMVLADIAVKEGRTEEALGLLERAAKVSPALVQPHVMLARVRYAAGDLDGADVAARAALELAPDDPRALFAMGQIAASMDRHGDAVTYFTRQSELQPAWATVWYYLGVSQLELNDRAAARVSLERSLELEPNSLETATLHAMLDVGDGRAAEALATARRLQETFPTLPAPYVLEAEIQSRILQFPEAAAAYERAYAIQPSATTAVQAHQARVRAGGDGLALLRSWLGDHPDDVRVRMIVAEHLGRVGDKGAAIAEYLRSLEVNAGNVAALNNVAWLMHQQGDDRAQAYARQAYELQPDVPLIQGTLGWILVDTGRLDEGRPLLEQANEKLPQNGDIAYHLAVALEKSGDREQSRRLLETLLATDQPFESRADAERMLAEIDR